jgi:putative hydrolase of HD superfamily
MSKIFPKNKKDTTRINRQDKDMKAIVNFITEIFSLKYLLRSSYQVLSRGLGQETIAEHSFMTAVIGYMLSKLENADTDKVILMCLLHDILETRIGDANFIHRRYQILFEDKAMNDMLKNLPDNIKGEINQLYKDLMSKKTLEARLVHEADILEELFQEKHYFEIGNQQAKGWMEYSLNRLKNQNAKRIGRILYRAKINEWWDFVINKPPVANERFKTLFSYLFKEMAGRQLNKIRKLKAK